MKKIILTLLVAGSFTLSAQEITSSKGENYLPEANDWALTFNADGVFNYLGKMFTSGNTTPTFASPTAGTFVGKKFITDKEALRVLANLNINSQSTSSAVTETSTSSYGLTAGLGKEWRRGKTRLQGFYGVDGLVMFGNTSSSNTSVGVTKTEINNGLNFGLGGQGFVGAEYFIFPKMSLGAQFTYRLMVDGSGESETTVTNLVTNAATITKGGSGFNFNLGSVAVPSINLNVHF